MFLKLALFSCLVVIATARYVNPHNGFRTSRSKIGARIVGGEEAAEHEFPHQISIQVGDEFPFIGHICGGSIIDKYWILTAGHCPLPGFPHYIKAGKHSLEANETTEQLIKVERIYVHEKYNPGVGPYDIGLLKLEKPLVYNEFVKPIDLPERESQVDGEVVLSGWGATDGLGNDYPDKLQKVKLPIVDWKTCKSRIEHLENGTAPVTEKNVCAGTLTGGISACFGDSGGPLIKLHENGHKEVVGITSWVVVPCGTKGAPSVYTRVSAFIDWIQDIISKDKNEEKSHL